MANWGKAAAGAVAGMGQGLLKGMELDRMRAQDEQNRQRLAQEAELLQMKREEAQQQRYGFASERFGVAALNALDSTDVGGSMRLQMPQVKQFLPVLGLSLDEETLIKDMDTFGKNAGAFGKTFKQSLKNLGQPNMTVEAASTAYKQGAEAFDNMLEKAPIYMQPYLKQLRGQLDAAAKPYRDSALKMQETSKANAEKKTEITPYQQQLAEFRLDRAATEAKNKIYTNPVYKKLADQEINADFLTELVQMAKDGNQVAASSMGAKAARAMGEVGVLTESDIQRYVRGGSIARATADKLLKWVSGKPSDMTLDEINAVQGVFQRQFDLKVQPIINREIETFTTNWLNGKKDDPKRNVLMQEAEERLGFKYKALSDKKPAKEASSEVRRKTKDGKVAIFDAKSKKFLRYE